MALWGGKKVEKEEDVPESLRGKTPEQIAQALADGETAKATLAAKESETTTMKSDLQQARERIQALERNANPPKPKEEQKGPTSVLVDEDAAFNERLSPFAVATLQNSARMARIIAEDRIKSDPKDGPVFRKFYTEYDALIKQLSLEQQALEASYDNVFSIIKGRHLHEILEAQKKGDGSLFVEPGGGSPPEQKPKEEKLNDQELAAASRMGVSPEDYLKSKKQIQFV
jgi:hypothetical protein